ncbi:hypothetical protein EJ06DRAFT_59655 [Trichodelitschia bisporula]|uniref:Uncharacterized protein n=1 Tax=Trichodelitschia bisporula TaxID=703511 RepID=A0A6G1HV35_9PEZI|nr:hypothetical protein EJ06DRAFT_59655 [Trichodelitschia bisporula]
MSNYKFRHSSRHLGFGMGDVNRFLISQVRVTHKYVKPPEPAPRKPSCTSATCIARIHRLIAHHADERLAALKEAWLQADHDELHTGSGMTFNVCNQLRDICVVERRVHLIKHEERRRLVRMYRKKQCQRSHCLLATGQVLHIAEPLERGHGVILETIEVRLVRVLGIKIPIMSASSLHREEELTLAHPAASARSASGPCTPLQSGQICG